MGTSSRGRAPTAGPPITALLALAVTAVAAWALLPQGPDVATNGTRISLVSVAGWLLGIGSSFGCFCWFRSANTARSSLPGYAIPRWRPALVAALLVACAVAAGLGHAWVIADAWSRR
jgi:hypothetical protein